jgi:hypothetical protein
MDLAPLPPNLAELYLSTEDTPALLPMASSSARIAMPDMESEASYVGVILDANDSRPNSDPVFMRIGSLRNRPVSGPAANSSRVLVIMQDDKEFLTAECESLSDSLVSVGIESGQIWSRSLFSLI